MKNLKLFILLLLVCQRSFSQAPEIWGVAKSTINSSSYTIYKTDTSLNNPVSTVKVLSSQIDGTPTGNLVKGIYDSLIYGVLTSQSGLFKIYKINTLTNHFSILYQTTTANQGTYVVGELMKHPNGKYYGMTYSGGSQGLGVLFEWNPIANTYQVKHHFSGVDGSAPRSNASLRYCNNDGYFYGLTEGGGTNNYGVLFRYKVTTNTYEVINNFDYNNGIVPNGSVQLLEYANGDLNILYTLCLSNSNNWGTLCNTRYTNSTTAFTTTYHSFSGLYFYNNTMQFSNPKGEIIRLKTNNSNNDAQFMGMAKVGSQNLYALYSFAVNKLTKQIYTNTSLNFTSYFPTDQVYWTSDNIVQSNFANGVVYLVTNGLSYLNINGSFIRKYYPMNNYFAVNRDIYNTQNLSNLVDGCRPYIHIYSPCVAATLPTLSSSATSVCNNNPVTLSINGGSLNGSTAWNWYTDSCGGNIVGTGTSITITQSVTTTYYVRGEGGCSTNGNCANITVYCFPAGNGNDLLFSEYIEGSSNNKALEIFNPTSTLIDLSIYKVELYINGSTSPTNSQVLTGNLAPGDVFVLSNSGAASQFISIANILSNACNYNGDDAIVLKKNNVPIDIIGEIGIDPGLNWPISGGGATSDFTLVRDSMVINPETNWTISQNQWYVYPINTTSYLGYHKMHYSPNAVEATQASQGIKIYPNPGNGLITVQLKEKSRITITNSMGQIIYDSKIADTNFVLNIHEFASGMYFIKSSDKVTKYLKL
ncbi:MAG: lamin tail domain-containing protein [Bacteroidetes bacterium]|nr:lamin tail domain-containing protein [Bacteroidota bacterium]